MGALSKQTISLISKNINIENEYILEIFKTYYLEISLTP